ncbi:MAG: type IIL restriction-modification enzyme MmeI, partial [Candidatus Dormibacteraceae bacterium]
KTIRETSSRKASLDYVTDHGGIITQAVSSQPWSGDAAVTVSIVNWIKNGEPGQRVLWLNNTDLRLEVDHIPPTLTPGIDVRRAAALTVNQRPKVCFKGQTPGVTRGFTLDAATRETLIRRDPSSARYIHPFLGGEELLHNLTIDRWIIDLPHLDALEAEHDTPVLIDHLRREVLPARKKAAQKEARQNAERLSADPKAKIHRHHSSFLDTWWMHSYRRTEMVVAVEPLVRYIALTITATWERPSVYSFIDSSIRPVASLQVFAFDDNYSFGILSSGLHRLWFEARCSRLKADLRYTPTTVFDSFPWPQSPTEAQAHTVQEIVEELLALRSQNLSAGMSLAHQYDTLRQPGNSQLRNLHADLDAAVLNAYGFSPDEDLLAKLLALNLDIAAEPQHARGPGSTSMFAGELAHPDDQLCRPEH